MAVVLLLLLLLGIWIVWKMKPELFSPLRELLTSSVCRLRILNGAVPNRTASDGAVPDRTPPDGAVPNGTAPDGAVPGGAAVQRGGVAGFCVSAGGARPGGGPAGPDCVLDLQDEEEALKVPLLCDNPGVVGTVDVPNSEADQDPDGTSCGVPFPGVEAAQQEELKSHV